jgi:hypothetical protein
LRSVPYQSNGWDCGVFVCRYAYGFKCIQSLSFSYAEVGYDPGHTATWFETAITNSTAFRFGDGEIASLRVDMKILIERLSEIYGPWSLAQKRNRQLEKKPKIEIDDTLVPETVADSAPVAAFDLAGLQGDIDGTVRSIATEKNGLCLGTTENSREIEDLRILGTNSANTVSADGRKADDGTPVKTAEIYTSSANELCGNEEAL